MNGYMRDNEFCGKCAKSRLEHIGGRWTPKYGWHQFSPPKNKKR